MEACGRGKSRGAAAAAVVVVVVVAGVWSFRFVVQNLFKIRVCLDHVRNDTLSMTPSETVSPSRNPSAAAWPLGIVQQHQQVPREVQSTLSAEQRRWMFPCSEQAGTARFGALYSYI